jgi:nucleotide-binding universal stress UspA family protein
MLTLDKVLLPLTFTESCKGAARYAQALAAAFPAEFTLLHVHPLDRYEFAASQEGDRIASKLTVGRRAQIQHELKEYFCKELSGLKLKTVILEGDPAQQIVSYAHTEKFDLIIMPTHGYGPFRRFILGSVTAKVLHDADCPSGRARTWSRRADRSRTASRRSCAAWTWDRGAPVRWSGPTAWRPAWEQTSR